MKRPRRRRKVAPHFHQPDTQGWLELGPGCFKAKKFLSK